MTVFMVLKGTSLCTVVHLRLVRALTLHEESRLFNHQSTKSQQIEVVYSGSDSFSDTHLAKHVDIAETS